MIALVDTIEREVGPIEVAVYNIGANVRFPIRETTARVFFKVWEMACFGGFLMGREVAKRMVPRGRGTILFTGATASVRGGSGYRGVRERQARAARAGAEHGARARARGHPRRACRDRRRDRHGLDPRELSRARRAEESRTASSIRRRSPRTTGCCTASRAAPGRTSSICGRGSRSGSWRFRRAGKASSGCRPSMLRRAALRALPALQIALKECPGAIHVDCRSRPVVARTRRNLERLAVRGGEEDRRAAEEASRRTR